jgi:hypothetical protein
VPDSENVFKLQPTVPNSKFLFRNCVVEPASKAAAKSASTAFSSCYGLTGKRTLYLVGDSHAEHFMPMLGEAENGFFVRAALKGSCLISRDLLIDYQKNKYIECSRFSNEALYYIAYNSRPGDVVMISTWLNRHLGLIDANGKRNDALTWFESRQIDLAKARVEYVKEMRKYAVRLSRKNVKLVLVVDVPPLARNPVTCYNAWNFNAREKCLPALPVSRKIHSDTALLLSNIARGLRNVYVFDPAKYLFSSANLFGDGRVTLLDVSGRLIYSDLHHLTVSASKGLAPSFVKFASKNNLSP